MPQEVDEEAPAQAAQTAQTSQDGGDVKDDGASGEGDSAEQTNVMARIDSAIPSDPEPYEEDRALDGGPRLRVALIPALAAIVLIGAVSLYIVHPWNPDLFSTKATEPLDTSNAGSLESVERLQGQDTSGADEGSSVEGSATEMTTYDYLTSAYEGLGEASKSLTTCEQGLRQGVSDGADEDTRSSQKATYDEAALKVSNILAELGQVSDSTGAYEEDLANLMTLGNWLRNWSDALGSSFDAYVESADPSGDEETILAPLSESSTDSGTNAYKELFDENYEAYRPKEADSQE